MSMRLGSIRFVESEQKLQIEFRAKRKSPLFVYILSFKNTALSTHSESGHVTVTGQSK